MKWLTDAAAAAKNLEGVVVTRLPDCVQWVGHSRAGWDRDEVAAYFGDIARANRNALKTVGTSTKDIGLTMEADDRVILTHDIRHDMVAVYIFDKNAPLGMIRLQAKKLSKVITANLPTEEVAERSRAERVMEFLLRYAPDAHAIPIRVSLQTGIPIDLLKAPEGLDTTQTQKLESAAKAILGVTSLRI